MVERHDVFERRGSLATDEDGDVALNIMYIAGVNSVPSRTALCGRVVPLRFAGTISVRCRNWYYSALKWSRGTPRPGSGTGATARPRQLGIGLAGSPRRAALAEPHAASTSLLSQRPIHPHRPGPTPRAFVAPQSGSETASWTCLRTACGLRARLGLSAAATCLLGPCCNDRTPLEPLCSV